MSEDIQERERAWRLDKAYDAINSRFGGAAIMRCTSVQSKMEVGTKYWAQMEQKKGME